MKNHNKSIGRAARAILVGTIATVATLPAVAQIKGGTLTIGALNDPRGFEALKSGFFDTWGEHYAQLMMEPLVRLNADGSVRPALATEWQRAADGKSWTFKMRQGVRFHDGTPFTANDVVHHLNRIIDPKNKYMLRAYIKPVKRVVAVDDYTVKIVLDHPWAPLLALLTIPNMIPLIPSSAQVESGQHLRKPVGTGPFKLESWLNGDRMVLVRNPDYWNKDAVWLDRVVFQVLPNETSRLAALRTGQIDATLIAGASNVNKAENANGLQKFRYDGAGGLFFRLNARRKHLSDPRVRAAIAHAFNQEAFVKVVFNNTRSTIEHLLGPKVDCGDVGHRAFNPEKAKALLADYGKPVALTLVHNAERGNNAALVQQMLGAVGITLNLEPVDQKTRVKRSRGGKFDMVQWGTRPSPDMGSQLSQYTHSKSKLSSGFADKAMDALLERMRTVGDPTERIKIQCQVSALINQSAHLIFDGGNRRYAFASTRIKGLNFDHGLIDPTSAWIQP